MVNSGDKEFIARTHNAHSCVESDSQYNAGSNNIRHFLSSIVSVGRLKIGPQLNQPKKYTSDVAYFSYMLLYQ